MGTADRRHAHPIQFEASLQKPGAKYDSHYGIASAGL
jgi:hypothetical protein